jgi:hypothetical protein
MRDKLLITVAAVALLAGTGFAAAQGPRGGAEPAAKMDQGATPESGKADKGGQDMKGRPGPAAAQGSDEGKRKGAQAPGKPKSAQQAEDSAKPAKAASEGKGRMSTDEGKGRMSAEEPKRPGKAESGSKPMTSERPAAAESAKPSTTAQGAGKAEVNLTADQRSRIRQTVIKETNAPRVSNVNFKLTVGTVVPKTVRVVPVPATIVEIQPAWRGFLYFLVGDQVVIVEPGTLRIVAIIAA